MTRFEFLCHVRIKGIADYSKCILMPLMEPKTTYPLVNSHSYLKLPCMVSFTTKKCDFHSCDSYVELPWGKPPFSLVFLWIVPFSHGFLMVFTFEQDVTILSLWLHRSMAAHRLRLAHLRKSMNDSILQFWWSYFHENMDTQVNSMQVGESSICSWSFNTVQWYHLTIHHNYGEQHWQTTLSVSIKLSHGPSQENHNPKPDHLAFTWPKRMICS